jgi:hypothetical protein
VGYLTGDSKNAKSKALEMDVCFKRAPLLGKMEGPFPKAFQRRDISLFSGIFIKN